MLPSYPCIHVTTERMPRRSREHMQLMNDDDALIKRVRRSK
jgi:hypothetical protein